ncbi:MAG: SLC26A/SulP transporter family protein [Pseudolabrys sp.]|nr:SLC26A/SulP transporter family protein [Pseudolabrys sp.]
MPSLSFTNLRRDIEGGLVSAAVAIPLSVAFGMFAFVSLGDQYFVHGAMAGFIASFVASALGILIGHKNSVTIYAPRITTTFFLGALLYGLAHVEGDPVPVGETLLVLFSIIALGGLFQALFGLVRLGSLIKFTPHPVMAGFQNMAAILLFVVQFANVLGYNHNVRFTQVQHYFAEAKPAVLAIAAFTFIVMWNAKRITTAIPPLLLGLAAGTAAYYGVKYAGHGEWLGPVIGLPSPNVSIPKLYAALDNRSFMAALPGYAIVIVPGALALALIAAIDAMLCAKLASAPTDPRQDSNRLLVRLGLTNAVVGAAGGITAGINIGATVTNRGFGGTTWVSVAVNAALQLTVLLFLMPYVAYLPRSVLSAVVMVVAVQHIDPWSKDATGRFLRAPAQRWKSLGLDLLVALIVSVLSIAINIVTAVFIGVVLAVGLFVLRMSRSNVRRLYRCDAVRSRKARASAELATLESMGKAILAIELQGALFFGSAEHLAQVVAQEAAPPTQFVILDLRRVTEIDSTGARILSDIDASLARSGCKLALVLPKTGEVEHETHGISSQHFPDIDRAIEWAEDKLLGDGAATIHPELLIEEVPLLRDFSTDQMLRLRPYLTRAVWAAGSIIVAEGDPGSHLFLVTRGRASVRLTSEGRDIRLATFAPGSVFGELALLDRGPRSATVTADDEVTTWALSARAFDALRKAEPDLAVQILAALGRELSGRLRQANRTIHQLES